MPGKYWKFVSTMIIWIIILYFLVPVNSISARLHYWKYWLDQEQLSAFPSLSATTPCCRGQGEHVAYLILSHYQCMVTGNPSSVYSSEGHLEPESATVTRCHGLGTCLDINYPPMSRSWLLLVRCGHRLDQSQHSSASPPCDWLRVPGGAPRRL